MPVHFRCHTHFHYVQGMLLNTDSVVCLAKTKACFYLNHLEKFWISIDFKNFVHSYFHCCGAQLDRLLGRTILSWAVLSVLRVSGICFCNGAFRERKFCLWERLERCEMSITPLSGQLCWHRCLHAAKRMYWIQLEGKKLSCEYSRFAGWDWLSNIEENAWANGKSAGR